MIDPIQINDDAIYDDSSLVIGFGFSSETLAKARRSGRLRCNRIGGRSYMKGSWVKDWLLGQTTPVPAMAGEGR